MNATKPRKRKNNFIDNKEFYAALVAYREKCEAAKESGDDKPRIPRYIGKCFLDIAEHLSTRPNFFTQVCWYAFLRRIGKEKKQIEICDKIISKSGFEEFFVGDQLGTSSDYNSIKDVVDQRRKGNK